MTYQTATDSAAGRIAAFLDGWTAATSADRIEWVRVGNKQTPNKQIPLRVTDVRQLLNEREQLLARVAELEAERADTGSTHRELLARTYCPMCGERKTSLAHLNECLSLAEAAAAEPKEPDVPAEVTVRYEGAEWPINLRGMTTVKEILLFSLFNHGLPTAAHEKFALLDAAGAELAQGNAIFAGVKPGDVFTLKYTPDCDGDGV